MYLFFDESTEKKQLIDFKATQNYICFAFQNDVSVDDFTNISTYYAK